MRLSIFTSAALGITFLVGAVTCNLERIITHGHLSGQRVKACPSNTCKIDTTTRLYFWIKESGPTPNMYLRSGPDTLLVTTNKIDNPTLIPSLSREVKRELEIKASGQGLTVVEAIFPSERMAAGTYTYLICVDPWSWMAVDMVCVRADRFLERFRRGERLLCTLDKRTIDRHDDT